MSFIINGSTGISGVDGSAATPALQGSDPNTGISFGTDEVSIVTDGSSRATVDSSGRLLVGTSAGVATGSSVQAALQVVDNSNLHAAFRMNRNDTAGPTVAFGKSRSTSDGGFAVVQANDELGNIRFCGADGSDLNTQGAAIAAFVDGTPGANDMPGRLVFSTTADGAANPTERMRITQLGEVLIGVDNPSSNSYVSAKSISNTVGIFDRTGTDGTLIIFRHEGVNEGTIAVSGTTVSYNGAHLSRWSQLVGIDPHDKSVRPEILRGTVMSNLDEMCDWTCPISGDCQDNEQLNKTEISSVDDDPNVAGVFQSWDDDDDVWVNDFYLAMTGDFVIRIAAGTTVQRGDLLCSAGDGTARPQGDRYLKDSTIAKVTSTTVSCTHPDGSYCVPCVLMAC